MVKHSLTFIYTWLCCKKLLLCRCYNLDIPAGFEWTAGRQWRLFGGLAQVSTRCLTWPRV